MWRSLLATFTLEFYIFFSQFVQLLCVHLCKHLYSTLFDNVKKIDMNWCRFIEETSCKHFCKQSIVALLPWNEKLNWIVELDNFKMQLPIFETPRVRNPITASAVADHVVWLFCIRSQLIWDNSFTAVGLLVLILDWWPFKYPRFSDLWYTL